VDFNLKDERSVVTQRDRVDIYICVCVFIVS